MTRGRRTNLITERGMSPRCVVFRTGASCLFALLLLPSCGSENAAACAPGNRIDDEVTARPLSNTTDKDVWLSSDAQTLTKCEPDDFFVFHGEDADILHLNDPTIELLSGDLRLCVFVACSTGATTVDTCSGKDTTYESTVSDLGTPGCCVRTPDRLTVSYSCSDGLSTVLNDASADIFVHVCPYAGSDPPNSSPMSTPKPAAPNPPTTPQLIPPNGDIQYAFRYHF